MRLDTVNEDYFEHSRERDAAELSSYILIVFFTC